MLETHSLSILFPVELHLLQVIDSELDDEPQATLVCPNLDDDKRDLISFTWYLLGRHHYKTLLVSPLFGTLLDTFYVSKQPDMAVSGP